ncbi:cobalt ECF transporter T component CbiQ [Paenibacillus sp. Soil724D2]|uniref:cobalt ECF transporter T component CbiQ n=1 Tax=Paenibacillus sp. (strain Soil724D2) TaxID=1736392 RepID=UPI000714CA52|nr:cobalt ECF transporter T component CbiQ [Paenibacillus sp. Soil724D2]KRE48695.1 cobalt ABC transporter permease [Paenibacillus sp. Soil724D2]
MMKLIDSLSYKNALRPLSPMWKCGFAVTMLLFSYLTHPAVQVIIAIWMAVWTVVYARIPIKYYVTIIGAACLFFVGSVPAIVVEVRPLQEALPDIHEVAAFTFMDWKLSVSSTALLLIGKLFVRIIASLSCVSFIMFSTPFSEMLQVLQKVRVPKLVLEIMLIMYRFLFILFEIANNMYVAQQSRGGQTGFQNRLKDTAIIIVQMFIKTMQRYKSLSNGLVSRGFTDDIHMAPYRANPVPFRYKLESYVGLTLLLLLEIWLRWNWRSIR